MIEKPDYAGPVARVLVPDSTLDIYVPLEGIVDLAKEKQRLEKQLDKNRKELAGLKTKLTRGDFVNHAPEELIAATREEILLKEGQEIKLAEALRLLGDT